MENLKESENAVLVLGGAFNPVHTQHIEVMRLAKEYLETKTNFKIIEGYLAVSTDNYVKHKMKDNLSIKSDHRIKMCNLAIQDYDWIKPTSKSYASAGLCAIKCKSNKEYKTIIVLGADRAISRNGNPKWRRKSKSDVITIIIGRKGETDNVRTLFENDLKNNIFNNDEYYFYDTETKDVSSTKIREKLNIYINDELNNLNSVKDLVQDKMLDEKVANYLIDNKNDLFY